MAVVAVPTVRGIKDGAKDYAVGLAGGAALRIGREIFGNNILASLGIAAVTGAAFKGARGQQLSVMMGVLALNG